MSENVVVMQSANILLCSCVTLLKLFFEDIYYYLQFSPYSVYTCTPLKFIF